MASHRDASALLLKKLRVVMADNGNFMRVSLSGEDPQRAADVVNGLTVAVRGTGCRPEAGEAP